MAHLSEEVRPLSVQQYSVRDWAKAYALAEKFSDVCIVILPSYDTPEKFDAPLANVGPKIAKLAKNLGEKATFIVIGEVVDLIQVHAAMPSTLRYHHWIAIKRRVSKNLGPGSLPNQHFGALIYTKYQGSLRHTTTRIKYTYCPVCHKTTKDYGGKKHVYHQYGTLISDVWKDLICDLEGDLSPIIKRFQDLFGVEPYNKVLVLDLRQMGVERVPPSLTYPINPAKRGNSSNVPPVQMINQIINGDCIEHLRSIPNNSIDFIFVDPPYNLGKKYLNYDDGLKISDYFEWCDQWLGELARILKPGHTLAVLNIPLWAIRHFLFLYTHPSLKFQNWIVWDALAFPVRRIMPAHYTILAFSKGNARPLPGLTGKSGKASLPPSIPPTFDPLHPLAEGYCLREKCVKERQTKNINDRGELTDLWGDIHRLKHNSRRVNHPTQLPPHLMYRLIEIFTQPGEIVLDCFNGAGTTTLAAHLMRRRYIGVEKVKEYCDIAIERHKEIKQGVDPFRKAKRALTAKNSRVPRLPQRKYEIPKKELQLEVKRVAQQLGHLPSREELKQLGKYSIKYYDEYFVSWGEVCAAARTTGMTENMPSTKNKGDVVQEV